MRLYNYLNEKTFELGKDVDLIYDRLKVDEAIKYMKTDLEKFIDNALHIDMDKNLFIYSVMKSDELRTDDALEAHRIKPISIQFGVYESSFYSASQNTIFITINPDVFGLFFEFRSEEEIKNNMPLYVIRRMKSELSSTAIKSSIYHELSHWVDDVTHGLGFGQETFGSLDYRELNAQIHNIKQIYRDYRKHWDKLTLIDLVEIVPSLYVVYEEATNGKSEKEYLSYMKRFVKRLDREGLLGKKMRLPSRRDMVKALNQLNV